MSESIEKVLLDKSKKVSERMLTLVETCVSKELKEPILYLINAGGKRIRPALGLICADALGEAPHDALAPATSCELVHTASLIYDDILDQGKIRRNREPIYLKWSYPIAILAGNQLLSLAIKALTSDSENSKRADFAKNLDMFADAWVTLCDGKLLEVHGSFDKISDKQVLEIMYKKTAILFELAAKTGAIYAGAEDSVVESLRRYGKNVGMAFQIQDDILGLIGNEKTLGKDVGIDIKEGKTTLLISYIMSNGSKRDKDIVLKALGNKKITNSELGEVIDIIKDNGCVEHARGYAYNFVKEANSYLEVLPKSLHKKYLNQLAEYVISRVK